MRKMINRIVVLLLLWLISPNLVAQQPSVLSIRGRVVDRETKAALPYASVGLRGKPIGTVANAAGEFDFYLPASYARDTFFVSFLGYETYQAVAERAQANRVFELTVKSTQLAEVVVREVRLSAKEIVQRALARIGENYPTEPYLLEGFFRSWQKNEMPDSYVRQFGSRLTGSLLEAAVSVYDEGYNIKPRGKQLQEDVFIHEIRKTQAPAGQWEYHNWLGLLLKGNYVKYNRVGSNFDLLKSPLDLPNDLEYQLLEVVEDNGEMLYVIGVPGLAVRATATPQSTATYRLFISLQDYAILRIDLTGASSKNNFVHQSTPDTRWKCISVDNTLRFRRYKNKLYLSYLRTDWKTRKIAEETGVILEGQDSYRELLVNRIITTEVEERKKSLGKPMKEKQPMEEQLKTYHPDFWRHYNFIKDNPLDQDLIQLLEKDKQLDDQFNQSSPKK